MVEEKANPKDCNSQQHRLTKTQAMLLEARKLYRQTEKTLSDAEKEERRFSDCEVSFA